MEAGTCYLSQTGIGFLAAGLALPHLFFENESQGKQSILSWRDNPRDAYRCLTCGSLTICPPLLVEDAATEEGLETIDGELKKQANEASP